MTTPQPDIIDFDFELVAPISRFLTSLNKLQPKHPSSDVLNTSQLPKGLGEREFSGTPVSTVFSTVMNSASKISETISNELYNIMDATDSSMKEPNFNNLIKNITDIMSAQNQANTSNTAINPPAKTIPAEMSNTVINPPAKTIPAEMSNTVINPPASPDEPFSTIDLTPNITSYIEPPSYVDTKTPTTKTINLAKPFARDIPAMFSSKYMEVSNLNLPAGHKELRIKVNNDLYNAIEQAFNISISTLTKYTVQPYPSIKELLQEHNHNIRLPASSMTELVRYLSNYSGTYNPDEKMKITSHNAKHVKLLLIDWLMTHPDMYIVL